MGENLISILKGSTIPSLITDGNYGVVDERVTQNYKYDAFCNNEFWWILLPVKKISSPRSILENFREKGFRSAPPKHLLAFGAALPEVQLEGPVLSLGAICRLNGAGYLIELGCKDFVRSVTLVPYNRDLDAPHSVLFTKESRK